MCESIIRRGDLIYERALKRELEFWSHRRIMSDHERVNHPSNHFIIQRYLNEVTSGDPYEDWLDYVVRTLRPRGRAASLGSGIGFYERRLLEESDIESMDLYELCPVNLGRSHDRLAHCRATINYVDSDLNFPQFPENAYDLILARFFVHHIVNLEVLFCMIGRALRPGGAFVIYDYVGESRYRWDPRKRDFVNGLLGILREQGVPITFLLGYHPGYGIVAPDTAGGLQEILANSPFETIRAAAITPTIDAIFGEVRIHESRYGSVIHAAMRSLDFSDWKCGRLCQALELFVDLDRCLSAQNVFAPCGLFGIYGKPSSERHVDVTPWTEEQINLELGLEDAKVATTLT